MNHDYAHCADYDSKCPNGCFRGELVRDLRDNPRMIGISVSWMHFDGTEECQKRTVATVDVPIYDKEETYTNCSVQVLTNSVTGDVSIGWWQEEKEGDSK